jgi:hypothetical protein
VSTVPTLLDRLIDDAALFPPGNAPMAAAVPAHLRFAEEPYGGLVGRFLCPASRLDELAATLPSGASLEVGVIADTGLPGLPAALSLVASEPRLRLTSVEIPLPPGDAVEAARQAVAALPEDVEGFVEVPREPGFRGVLDVLIGAGVAAKARTGGATPAAFPTEAEMAVLVTGCVERGLPFKCTAGLHHAVRHRDRETGSERHGFVNLLLAVHAALSGGDVPAALSTRDTRTVAEGCRAMSEEEAARVRASFVGFGSCSIADPVADLTGLGLL